MAVTIGGFRVLRDLSDNTTLEHNGTDEYKFHESKTSLARSHEMCRL